MPPTVPARQGNPPSSLVTASTTTSTLQRSSPELSVMPRRLFASPEAGEGDADVASSCSDGEEIEALMKRPGPFGQSIIPRMPDSQEDKDHQALMLELRATADRILKEDEWKLPSSDQIVGFRD
ncbi:hypothetical protein RvY_14696 [Ramazzottius varieornatus]|uniref:Uncharacterized protein n=1 Tax=Ramazzottius varieornatus TaxID=947166 RepID=A0A1D1VS78_RAMVA|nr:hypothetical protein RvY_14696 [Ramazzottius varieornatus]